MHRLILVIAVLGACQTARRTDLAVPDSDPRLEHPSVATLVPLIDYHRHLQSPSAARLAAEPALALVDVPDDLAALLRERTERWNDSTALAELYTEQAVLLDPTGPRWVRGQRAVAQRVARYFRRAPYRISPIAWDTSDTFGYIAGYLTRADHFTHVLLALRKDDGVWRIMGESLYLDGPVTPQPVTAEQLVSWLDDAGVARAVVLSLAYWFGSPRHPSLENEYAMVRAENDWIAEQAAAFPDRLIAFCSFNPLKDYALEELDRCAAHGDIHGLKLHFGNSNVDLRVPDHVERVRQVFRAANGHSLPIVVHLWVPDVNYGREHSRIFLDRILPEAPDIVVQIAHFAGGGAGYSEEALAVFAHAIASRDPRTANLYFDITSVADGRRSDAELQRFVTRMREIGLERILFGSDMAPPPAWEQWTTFRMTVPLTDAEFASIAGNVAPYVR